ncbi:hypothetical protein BURC_00126 [Burkholderiaceae bacterium]|nr:hypothetical protein BURC_00126 [Burkholderiaceae bacterium]
MPLNRGQAAIVSADEFRRLLEASPLDLARVVSARAVSSEVWWDVLTLYPDLAVWVAANRTIPHELVAHLSSHPRIQVRVAIASSQSISDDMIEQLAHDKSDLVRMRVACNARAPREVLAHLVADPCVVVSKHAQARLQHDISGVMLPASYLDEVSVFDILH